jgi:hypothetical protein
MPVLDTFRHYTPLGLRFWDAATETRVTGPLRVRIWPESHPQQVALGRETISGDVAMHGIPGLARIEREGVPVGVSPGSLSPTTYVVQVDDPLRRYVSASFRVDLPRAERGFFTLQREDSPPDSRPPGIYLFSAPSRSVPIRLAVVRATLRRTDTGGPAAFAAVFVEQDHGGSPPDEPAGAWVGMADRDGSVQILFPYPPITFLPRSSPPGEGRPLSEQTWPLRLRVAYAPAELDRPNGAGVPTLRSVFRQSSATLRTDASPPEDAADIAITLRDRRPCIARTAGLPPAERGPLFVTPAGSPP